MSSLNEAFRDTIRTLAKDEADLWHKLYCKSETQPKIAPRKPKRERPVKRCAKHPQDLLQVASKCERCWLAAEAQRGRQRQGEQRSAHIQWLRGPGREQLPAQEIARQLRQLGALHVEQEAA